MTTFATPRLGGQPAIPGALVVTRQASRRDRLEAIGLLLGTLVTLLALAVTIGGAGPLG